MVLYKLNPIPETTQAWRVREAQRLRERFTTDAYEDDGVLRWKSNRAAVPYWCFDEAFATAAPSHLLAHKEETQRSLQEYREAQRDHVPDAEEMYEMRAAFGEGVTVVNAITGRRTQL